jgi:hypothetical protein
MTPIRIQIARDVLERAKDAGDDWVAGACRRVISAWRLGHPHDRRDMRIVMAFAER